MLKSIFLEYKLVMSTNNSSQPPLIVFLGNTKREGKFRF